MLLKHWFLLIPLPYLNWHGIITRENKKRERKKKQYIQQIVEDLYILICS